MRLACVWWPPGRTALCVCGVYRAVSSTTRTAPNSGCQCRAQTRARPLQQPRVRLARARARLSRWTRLMACPERASRWRVWLASQTRCRGSGPARASCTPGSATTRCALVYSHYARSSLNVLLLTQTSTVYCKELIISFSFDRLLFVCFFITMPLALLVLVAFAYRVKTPLFARF